MHRFSSFTLVFVLLFSFISATSAISTIKPDVVNPPPDFTDTLVTSVDAPTALAWLPDGRMLITRQIGQLIIRDGATNTTALTLGAKVCTNGERGLLGVAVDLNYTTNNYIYLYYTFNKFNQSSNNCSTNTTNVPVNRVSRFILNGNDVDETSELVLVDNMKSYAGNHNGGDVHFGKDGKLYISVGDAGCDYAGNSGCAGSNDAARDKHILLGKMLRINPDGSIPSDNPFYAGNQTDRRCNVSGQTTVGQHCQETWAWGLRNPFRFAMDPNAAGTRLYINDVGQNVWEEIDEGLSGADYGWNVREGHCANGSTSNCGAPPAGMTNPIYDYKHGINPNPSPFQNCNSITGGAFVPNNVWGSAYNGAYIFSDYVCGRIFVLQNGTASAFATGLGGSSAVHLAFGPYNLTQALYYTTYANGGEVRRIAYTPTGNNPPTANLQANPTSGTAPLSVTFDGSTSSDPDGDSITAYAWNFGDTTATVTTTAATISHSYANNGSYTASLRVRDQFGAISAPDTVQIVVGNDAPVPQILAPASNATFAVGDNITLLGSATDTEDGTLPPTSLGWNVLLHHDQHTHPFFAAPMTSTASFTAPAPEDLLAATNSYLEIQLIASDSAGQTTVITQALRPRKVNITFNTTPNDLIVRVNGTLVEDGEPLVSWDSYQLNVVAPLQSLNGRPWRFVAWNNGSTNPVRTIVTPATATTYTAEFAPAFAMYLPLIKR